ncbi:MAG: winged helix-turn-helix transcriptional regulator [Solirubrobacteraceae bacterium]|nr:winged helix-turn-helix transcriptional regulator [Solirubrobacteraceae bacterium]
MASVPASAAKSSHSLGLLAHLARVVQREADAVPAESGLRPRHFVVLMLLRDHGASTQRGLSETLRLDPTNLVGVLNDLESRDMVVRQRDPEDRRRHIVDITAAGLAELEKNDCRLREVEERVLGALSVEERETLHALLARAAGGALPLGSCTEPDAQGPPVC